MARTLERFRRTFSRNFEAGEGLALSVDNDNGPVNVRGGEAGKVSVGVIAELWAESARDADLELDRIQRGINHSGASLSIRTPELLRPSGSLLGWALSRAPKVEYEIEVPSGTAVSIRCRNGRTDVRNLEAAVEIEGQNGPLTLTEVVGPARLSSRNGSIRVRQAGGVSATSRNGSLTIDGASGPVVCETNNGSVEVINPGGPVQARTRNGSVRYRGRVLGPVQVETRNGGIRFGVPAGSRFELDASSAHGSVRSDLEVRESSASTPPRHVVRLRSDNGSIRIEEDSLAGLPGSSSGNAPETSSTA